jgi:hypothetical protein
MQITYPRRGGSALTVKTPGSMNGYAWWLPAVARTDVDGFEVELVLDAHTTGSLRCTSVTVKAKGSGEVTRRALRDIKLGELVSQAIDVAATGEVEVMERDATASIDLLSGPPTPDERALAMRAARPARGAGRWSPHELRRVLEVAARARPREQTRAIRREFVLSASGAKWVLRRARAAQAAGEL